MLTLMVDMKVVHTTTERFGFRTFEVRPGQGLFLNGRKIRLKGVNRHCFWPDSGRCLSQQVSYDDVRLIKQMNMNAVRMSHYPPDKHFLEACDELGLYLLDELAGWQRPPYHTEIGVTENGRELVVKVDALSLSFDKATGQLARVKKDGVHISFAAGPRLVTGSRKLAEFKHHQDGNDIFVEARYDDGMNAKWKVYPSGWVRLDYQYELDPLSKLDEKGRCDDGRIRIESDNHEYGFSAKNPVVTQWTVLDFLMRRANPASDVTFDLLQDLSLFKPSQVLTSDDATAVRLKDGRSLSLQTCAQTGQGVLPIHYLLDEQRRPQLVTNSILSWSLAQLRY